MTDPSRLTTTSDTRTILEQRDRTGVLARMYTVELTMEPTAAAATSSWSCTSWTWTGRGEALRKTEITGATNAVASTRANDLVTKRVALGYTLTDQYSTNPTWRRDQVDAFDMVRRDVDCHAFAEVIHQPHAAVLPRLPADVDWRIAIAGDGSIDLAVDARTTRHRLTVPSIVPHVEEIFERAPRRSTLLGFQRRNTLYVTDATCWNGVDIQHRPWAARHQILTQAFADPSTNVPVTTAVFRTTSIEKMLLTAYLTPTANRHSDRAYTAFDVVRLPSAAGLAERYWYDLLVMNDHLP